MTGLINTAGDGSLAPRHLDSDAVAMAANPELDLSQPLAQEPWRDEVAARLARYRARRKPRGPRFPSLRLPFESDNWPRMAEPPSFASPPEADSGAPVNAPVASAHSSPQSDDYREAEATAAPRPLMPNLAPEPTAKIIEFPRSAAIPLVHENALADPIFDRPRIVEAPEVLPPPPALGGILIEPVIRQPAELRAKELRIPSASIPRRLLATAVDGFILIVSISAFAAIFLRFNPFHLPAALVAGVVSGLTITLWFIYQYLFVVYTGSTPGLRAVRLEIVRFDGSSTTRSIRRWRVLASALSGLSAGLGYLWSMLDSDSLCWHDRITKTYIRMAAASKTVKATPDVETSASGSKF